MNASSREWNFQSWSVLHELSAGWIRAASRRAPLSFGCHRLRAPLDCAVLRRDGRPIARAPGRCLRDRQGWAGMYAYAWGRSGGPDLDYKTVGM